MKTYSFIGSDKNAGKTTAFTFVYQSLQRRHSNRQEVCLTSIGINGEPADSYDNAPKPKITIREKTHFITAGEQLKGMTGTYAVRQVFTGPAFSKPYVWAVALQDIECVLEGPNDKVAIKQAKQTIGQFAADILLLIDGSIDRQFLGDPSISDGICFSLLLSDRPEQQSKADDLLFALSLAPCSPDHRAIIDTHWQEGTRSILCSKEGRLLYRGFSTPFLDESLKSSCTNNQKRACLLYLNGALTPSFYRFLAAFEGWTVILDNLTCYHSISVQKGLNPRFRPVLQTRHTVPIAYLFIREDNGQNRVDLPVSAPVINLFRDVPHEIEL